MKHVMVLGLLLVAARVQASDSHCSVGDIEYISSKGQFSGRLKVEIKLTGDELESAEKIRVNITQAADDTGLDLIKKEKFSGEDDFRDPGKNNAGENKIDIELMKPSTKATAIKELSGEIELYCPGKDPEATVKFEQFMKNAGKPIDSPSLRRLQVKLTVFDKKAYEEFAKKEAAAKQKAAESNVGKQLVLAVTNLFDTMSEAFSKNSVIVKLEDPQSKIIGLRFYSASGQKIDRSSWSSSGDIQTYSFNDPMPADAAMVIMLKTDKAIRKIPVKFTDIPLP